MNDFAGHSGASSILYEFPLRDGTQLLLRLEILDQQLKRAAEGRGVEPDRATAYAVLSAVDLLFREDLRARLMQQIYRLQRNYEILRARSDIDQEGLEAVLAEFEQFRKELAQLKSVEARALRSDPLIGTLLRRGSLTHAAMAADLPMYQWWLHSPAERKREDVKRWAAALKPLTEANGKFLGLLRQRGEFRDCEAGKGSFTASVTHGHELWMVRIAVAGGIACFPQISGASDGGRIHVRFMRAPSDKNAGEPYRADFPFRLAVC